MSGRAGAWGDAAQSLGLVQERVCVQESLCVQGQQGPPARPQGSSRSSARSARRARPSQSAARSPVLESLFFHLKAATVWQRTLSTLCVHKLSAGPRARPAGSRLHSQTPPALKRNSFTPREARCFVKVLLGWLSTENSLEKSLYISCKQKPF